MANSNGQRKVKPGLVSQRQYARMRNVSSSWISRLCRSGALPMVGGRIDPVAADRALEAAGAGQTTGESITLHQANVRWRLACAKLRELEYQEKSRTVVYVADIQREIERTFGNVRSALLALPVKMAPCLSAARTPAEVSELLRHEIYSVLQHLADHAVDDPFRLPEDALPTPSLQ